MLAIVTSAHRSALAAKAKHEAERTDLIARRDRVLSDIVHLKARTERAERAGPTRGVAGVYEAIGRLNCDDERDAWVIVGAAACSIGVESTRAAAVKKLSGADLEKLDTLCEEVRER